MVIDYFDVRRTPAGPHETDAPLVIDPDRVLAAPVSAESLQVVSRRKPQVLNGRGGIHG